VLVVLHRTDTGQRLTLRGGEDPVVVSGPPSEVVLFLFGRAQTRDLTFEGPPASVAKLRGADLGI